MKKIFGKLGGILKAHKQTVGSSSGSPRSRFGLCATTAIRSQGRTALGATPGRTATC